MGSHPMFLSNELAGPPTPRLCRTARTKPTYPSTRACTVRSKARAPAMAMGQSGNSQPRNTRQNHSRPANPIACLARERDGGHACHAR
eukprot:6536932-Lingulodinium_polyedra.AAC.1